MSKRAQWDPEDWQGASYTDEMSARLLRTNFSPRFVGLMKAAMLVSAYKYGEVSDAYPDRANALDSLHLRLTKYAETGNVEYLVDAANFAMIEFMCPAHPNAHFQPTDANGSPGRIAANAAIYDQPNQYKNRDLADKDEKPF